MMEPNQKPIVLFDFEGYDYYLAPALGKVIAKELTLASGYEVEKTDYIRLEYEGQDMQPTLPPGSSLHAQIVALAGLPTLTPGVYAVVCVDRPTGKISQVLLGRLKQPPARGSLTLWPDQVGAKKNTISLRSIGFVFRITQYTLSKQ